MDYFRDVNRDNVVISRYCAPRSAGYIEVPHAEMERWRYAHRVKSVQGMTRLHDLVWVRVTTNGGRFRVWTHDGELELPF